MSNFQTTLRVQRQPDGRYTLTATTITPDAGHMAAKPLRSNVVGQPVPTDHVAVTLPVVAREPRTGMPSTIHHVVPNLALGKDGKLGVTAFLVSNPDHGIIGTTTIRLIPSRSGRLVPVPTTRVFTSAPSPAGPAPGPRPAKGPASGQT